MSMLRRLGLVAIAAGLATSLAACELPGSAGNPGDKDGDPSGETLKNVHKGEITQSETWKAADSPHLVTEDVYVQDGATLTIEPGTTVKFAQDTALYVGYSTETGYLKAIGTGSAATESITFTSALPNPAKGSWKYLWFENGGGSSVLQHVKVEYAGGQSGNQPAAIFLHGTQANPTLTNTTISNSKGHGIYGDNDASFKKFEHNTITTCDESPIRLDARRIDTLGGHNALKGNASGKDFIEVNASGSEIDHEATWLDQGVPYRVTGDRLRVGKNAADAVLTLDPGVELQFADGIGLYVGESEKGALRAIGTAEKPVVFRGLPGNENAGVWEGVVFFDQAVDGDAANAKSSKLEHVALKYGGNRADDLGWFATLTLWDAKPLLGNVTITKSTVGIKLMGLPAQGFAQNHFTSGAGQAAVTFVEMDDPNAYTKVLDERSFD